MKLISVGDLGEFWYGDYKEPFEQLEGAVPGHPVGVVLRAKEDPNRLLCAYCGKTYENLGSHVWWTHKMTARDYKSEVGLLNKSALVSERLRFVTSSRAIRHGLGKSDATRAARAAKPGRSAGDGKSSGRNNGRAKPEALNKGGRCYAQTLAVGRTVLRETGRVSEKDLRRHGIFETTIRRYFGTMDEFRRAVGANPADVHRWSAPEALGAIRHLAMDLGRTPTPSDARRYGLPTAKVYKRLFGGWAGACEKAGLIPNLPLPENGDTDVLVLTTYATLGSIVKTARHLTLPRARVEAIFHRFGAPFAEHHASGTDSRRRREWAADMARRLAGTTEIAA